MAMAKSKTIYDVHPGVAMMVKWVAELKETTAVRWRSGSHRWRKKGQKAKSCDRFLTNCWS